MNIVSAGASAVPGADDVKSLPVSASERLEVLAIKGTKLLHSLANTASSILAVASAKPGDDPYLSPELLKLSPAERHHKLCEQYINHSQELKSIVMQCGQLGEMLVACVLGPACSLSSLMSTATLTG